MDVRPHSPDEKSSSTTVTILVTGANSGLGFAICCRLIDEFLFTRPQSEKLHLLYSTRDARKGEDALKRLNAHLQQTLKDTNERAPGISLLLEGRIKLEGVLVDLTKLLTVKALAQQLLKRGEKLDAVVWNAGIAGWTNVNYLKATRQIASGFVEATTYPRFMDCDVGALAKPQSGGYGSVHVFPEPRLGQVFTANVFGHYMLTHWLAPLMDAESRIVWISSVSATPDTFSLEDFQCLHASMAYESSKRLTDLMVLTSNLHSTKTYVQSFLPEDTTTDRPATSQRPKMYVAHPGVVATSIADLNWFIAFCMIVVQYLARWVGSPWHAVTAYKGAISAVFTALAPPSQLFDLERREGKGKWGSAVDVFGNERVARTEIDGWGYGTQLDVKPSGAIATKRPGYKGTTKEMREEFEVQGTQVWKELEEMRVEWERRLGKIEVDGNESVDM